MTFSSQYINVAVALPVFHAYTYAVPESLCSDVLPGKRVLVPFGRRTVTGYVLGPDGNIDRKGIKNILDVLDETPLFPASMIPFFRWVADYYMYPIGEVIKCALPGGLNIYDYAVISITEAGEKALAEQTLTLVEHEILGRLKGKASRFRTLCRAVKGDISRCLIHRMESAGWVVRHRALKGASARSRMARYVSLQGNAPSVEGLSSPRRKIIDVLQSEGEMAVKDLKARVPGALRLIRPLEEGGYIRILKKRVYRDPFGEPIEGDHPPVLTNEQKGAVASVVGSLGKGFTAYLLAGVTGSGKTEVYMQVAAEAVKRGYSALVLVPEIALISQMERRFRARFGDCIAILHSGLSGGERYDQWTRIMRQEARIAIGARSAIFAPFEDIGVIIVDEEHDPSYKQESQLLYNARDMAVVRAKMRNGVVLLGSATPSIQSYYNVQAKKFIEVRLNERIENRPLPLVTVVDLNENRDKRGLRRFITSQLHQAMKETLARGEQVLLFLNRRGFASFPVCAACGESIRCKNCDISMTLHRRANAYKCHYCGFTRASASSCLICGSSSIKLLGLGTEKLETAVKSLFPDARIARLDRDTTLRKNSVLEVLKGLRNRTIDILVGTQMVAKGHDFPNITLVGIICADLSLSFPDFRAGERTFQLLAQVAGRAGRGAVPGRVILQSYNPGHFSISTARDQDFKKFYEKEIYFRKTLNYPPFARLIQLKISGKDPEKTRAVAQAVGNRCQDLKKRNPAFSRSVEILGPVEAPLAKIAKHYRWQILLRGRGAKPLREFVHQVVFDGSPPLKNRSVKTVVDVDPFFML